MKKIIAVLAVLSGLPVVAQVTPNISLNLPNYAIPNWNVPLNQNFTILDNYLGGVNSFPNPLKASITGTAANLSGGGLGSIPYQTLSGTTAFLAGNTTSAILVLCQQGTGTVSAAPTWCANTGSVTSFAAPSGSWPTWLVPTVTNSTTTPSLAVAASAIPNAALANAAATVNGQTCTLGSTCTVAAAAGTLTGATLASGVTASSLTSVGTISSGTWHGTPIGNSYLANNYTTVNGQVCTLGAGCTITTGSTANLSGGALGSVPYQSNVGATSFVSPNTTSYTYYLCETGTGSVGAAPAWCGGSSSGTVTSVGIAFPPTQFTVTGSPVTTAGVLNVSLNSPTGTGVIVLANAPSIGALVVTSSFTATSLVTNADLVNPATTVNGQTCTLGSTCTVTAAATGITVGTTTVGSGTTGYILYDNGGTLGQLATTGSGGVVLAASPALSGTPTAPTATVGTNTTQVATTAFVQSNISNPVSPITLTPGAAAGSGATLVCETGYTCNSLGGTIVLTVGTGATVGATYITAARNVAGTIYPNCSETIVSTQLGGFNFYFVPGGSTTSMFTFYVSGGTAPSSSLEIPVTYVCQ